MPTEIGGDRCPELLLINSTPSRHIERSVWGFRGGAGARCPTVRKPSRFSSAGALSIRALARTVGHISTLTRQHIAYVKLLHWADSGLRTKMQQAARA